MKKITLLIACLISSIMYSQNTVTVDGSKTWNSYINAFNTLDDSYAFGFSYDINSNKTTLTTKTITLQPNFTIWTNENANTSWFTNPTTPNKFIEASSYVENNNLAGTDLTFTANIDSHTINAGYTVVAFIKALDPDNNYATVVDKSVTLTNTMTSFTTSATGAELKAGYIIQYGFSVKGALANPTNEAALGSIIASAKDNGSSSNNIDVTIDGSNKWNGYINAFNTIDDTYAFGFSYDVADIKTTLNGNKITLQPNFSIWNNEKTNTSWFTNPTTPNKFIETSSFVENNVLAGSNLTFSGKIDSYTLSDEYSVVANIKALDPNNNYSAAVLKTVVIDGTTSSFSISATADELKSGFIIQYGFSVTGPLGDPANEAALGSVIISDNSATASVNNNELAKISMYPNPTKNTLNISASTTIKEASIYNVLGKKVMDLNINKTSESIDVSNLASGIYLIKYEVNNAIGTSKFIKK